MSDAARVAWAAELHARLTALTDGQPLAVQPVAGGEVPPPPRRRGLRTVDPGPSWPFVQFARQDEHLLHEVVWSTDPDAQRPATVADVAALATLGRSTGTEPTRRSLYLTRVRWWPEHEPTTPYPREVDLGAAVALTVATLRGPLGIGSPAQLGVDPS